MTYAAANTTGYANAFYPSSLGTSEAAGFIRRKIQEIAKNQSSTGSAQVSHGKTLELLQKVIKECSLPNWGGEGELPVSSMAKANAEKFLALLPSRFRSAEVSPEPDGAIALEWRYGPFKSVDDFFFWALDDRRLTLDRIVNMIEKTALS